MQRGRVEEDDIEEGEDNDLLRALAAGLLALFFARLALGMGGMGEPQDTYYYSSRSMIAITTVGDDGRLKTSVQEDSAVRTNIRGMRSDSNSAIDNRLEAPAPPLAFGWDGYP